MSEKPEKDENDYSKKCDGCSTKLADKDGKALKKYYSDEQLDCGGEKKHLFCEPCYVPRKKELNNGKCDSSSAEITLP